MTEQTYLELVEKVAALKEQRDQAAGALAEIERQLLDEFGLKSLAAARTELVRLEKLAKEKNADAFFELERLKKKWGKELGI